MKLDLFDELKGSLYPGRGIIVGQIDSHTICSIYFIMGRSKNSQNRVFVEDGENVKILPANPKLVEDPSLIIYYPVRKYDNKLIVTNGDQTDTIYNFLQENKSFEESLLTREFEPDSPNFTPRISAIIDFEKMNFKLSILKSEENLGLNCQRFFFNYTFNSNCGYFIHTYATNIPSESNVLLSFNGEPKLIDLPSLNIEELASKIWNSLNEKNKISLVVKYIDVKTKQITTKIINKYSLSEE